MGPPLARAFLILGEGEMLETCPWCRDDVVAHCKTGHPSCVWARCPRCKLTIDPDNFRAITYQGAPVEWPHSTPDAT